MNYIDIHTHVQFETFDEDRDDVISRALEEKTWMILVGTQSDTSKRAVEVAEAYEKGVFATVGLHPVHTARSLVDKKEALGGTSFRGRAEKVDVQSIQKLAENEKVVAIGECGLDYYRLDEDTKEKQRDAFEAQIECARSINKPLMVHIRNAYEDALALLKHYPDVSGNIHFFAGDWSTARQFLDLGFTLSFTGVITFTSDYDEVVRNAPLEMIMSETDAPYVTPAPYRGERNEPKHVSLVVKRIAEIRRENDATVSRQLFENAKRVFSL